MKLWLVQVSCLGKLVHEGRKMGCHRQGEDPRGGPLKKTMIKEKTTRYQTTINKQILKHP